MSTRDLIIFATAIVATRLWTDLLKPAIVRWHEEQGHLASNRARQHQQRINHERDRTTSDRARRHLEPSHPGPFGREDLP